MAANPLQRSVVVGPRVFGSPPLDVGLHLPRLGASYREVVTGPPDDLGELSQARLHRVARQTHLVDLTNLLDRERLQLWLFDERSFQRRRGRDGASDLEAVGDLAQRGIG